MICEGVCWCRNEGLEESYEDVQVEFDELSFRPTTDIGTDVLLGT